MKWYGKAEAVGRQVVEAFKAGRLPAAMAPVFLDIDDDRPCCSWSWRNRVLVALAGFDDARGCRQWNEVGRRIRKGERCRCCILAPVTVKGKGDDGAADDGGRVALIGFRSVPVFGYEQTDGAELPAREAARELIDALPLVEVAREWGLRVEAFKGNERGCAGFFAPEAGVVAVGVSNLSTWAHELVHAADHRLGALKERGQHWRSETVAELGGAVLLHLIGRPADADDGGAWEYVSKYAEAAGMDPVRACLDVLGRACEAVALILQEAERVGAVDPDGWDAAEAAECDRELQRVADGF